MSARKRKVGDAVVAALDTARAELEERENNLEQREEALRRAIEGAEHEKQLMAGLKPSDVLQISIGGTKLAVLRSTLCQYEPSLLAATFSGRWDDSVAKDADGAFFIDQPTELMMPLINFLRDKAIAAPDEDVELPSRENAACESIEMHTDPKFMRLVEYYGMTPFVYQLAFKLWRGDKALADPSFTCGPEPSVSCKAFSTYALLSVDHSRLVKSFEVVLGASAERVQIGWANIRAHNFQASVDGNSKGIGEEGASIALDAHHGSVKCAGAALKAVPQLFIQAGTVLTCERSSDTYRWFVDGVEKAAVVAEHIAPNAPGPGSALRYMASSNNQTHPFISAMGEWRVTQFTYMDRLR